MRTARTAILGILAVLLVLAAGQFVRGRIIAAKKAPERQEAQEHHTVVDAVAVTPKTLPTSVVAYGTIAASTTLQLIPEVGGRVVELARSLHPGTTFAAGDVLWQVDARDHELALKRIDAEVSRLQATLARLGANRRTAEERTRIAKDLIALAKADVDRYESLKQKGAASAEVLDRARATLEQRQDAVASLKGSLSSNPHEIAEVRAQIADAEARRSIAKLTLERTRVVAPFAGRVLEGMVTAGVILAPGKLALTIEDLSTLEVHAPLTLRELAWARLDGDAARVKLRGAVASDAGWPATFLRTAGPVDPRTQMQTLVFAIEGPGATLVPGAGTLAPGMFVSLEMAGRDVERAIEVPRRALREDGTVALVVDGALSFRAVEMVRDSGDSVILTGNLTAGDMMVVNPPRDAVDGELVRIRGRAASVAAATEPTAEAAP